MDVQTALNMPIDQFILKVKEMDTRELENLQKDCKVLMTRHIETFPDVVDNACRAIKEIFNVYRGR